MLFKRYADPLSLLRTYSLEGLADFILRLYDEENENQLWDVWLHRNVEGDFKTFKRKHHKKIRKKEQKPLSLEEEKEIIEKNMQFIKPVNKGGEKNYG